MILGVDYGTTRTVVAAVDRGNYPVVSFQTEGGDTVEWYPSLIAACGNELLFGLDAAARQDDPECRVLRSFKRELASLGPNAGVALGSQAPTALDLLMRFFVRLRRDLLERSNLRVKPKERLQAMVSVPANANSNQRFITLEAYRRAGFEVRGMINEPSAAGIEYAHQYVSADGPNRRERLAVYDLGGGTFDSAVIDIAERRHEVVSSEGIARLGGDDFDEILLALALSQAGMSPPAEPARRRLLEECREKKEGLHPNTRKIAVDLGRALEEAGVVLVSASDFYERCRPLLESTIETMERAVQRSQEVGEADWRAIAALYLVGGSSELPVVARLLRERYGRRVRKSAYPHAAVAIGLAIAADAEAGYTLRERFTRHFGVWREADDGRAVTLDILFEKGTALPRNGGSRLTRARVYHPRHNIGHFRYLECSRIGENGQPTGDITPWQEIFYPFEPGLRNEPRLDKIPVTRSYAGAQPIEELYSCDEHGIIEVSILNHADNSRRTFRLRG